MSDPIKFFMLEGQAKDAIPNGTRIVKCNSKPGDGHQDGDQGTVYSSLELSEEEYNAIQEDKRPPTRLCYFVLWDDFPHPVGIAGHRIKVPDQSERGDYPVKLKCECCGFEQEFLDGEEAFREGWDAPPHFHGEITCNLCPASFLMLERCGIALGKENELLRDAHLEQHQQWKLEGRPKEFIPPTLNKKKEVIQ